MKQMIRIWGFIFSVIFLTSCSPNTYQIFRIGVNNWVGYAPLYLAHKRMNRDLPLAQVITFGSSTDVLSGLRNNTIEAAGLTLDEAITLASEGVEIDIILAIDASYGGDALITKNSELELNKLKGKHIGVEESAVGALMLGSALKKVGLTRDDISIQYCTFNQHPECYKNSDAIITFEPVLTKLKSKGAHVLFSSDEIPNQIIDVLVVKSSVHKNNNDVIQRLLNSYFYVINGINSSPNDWFDELSQFSGLSPTQASEALSGIKLLTLQDNKQLFDNKLHFKIEEITSLLLEFNLLKHRKNKPLDIIDKYIHGVE